MYCSVFNPPERLGRSLENISLNLFCEHVLKVVVVGHRVRRHSKHLECIASCLHREVSPFESKQPIAAVKLFQQVFGRRFQFCRFARNDIFNPLLHWFRFQFVSEVSHPLNESFVVQCLWLDQVECLAINSSDVLHATYNESSQIVSRGLLQNPLSTGHTTCGSDCL